MSLPNDRRFNRLVQHLVRSWDRVRQIRAEVFGYPELIAQRPEFTEFMINRVKEDVATMAPGEIIFNRTMRWYTADIMSGTNGIWCEITGGSVRVPEVARSIPQFHTIILVCQALAIPDWALGTTVNAPTIRPLAERCTVDALSNDAMSPNLAEQYPLDALLNTISEIVNDEERRSR